MIGIYKIENKLNHKVYIGRAKNITSRWREHRTRAFQKTCQEYECHLYRAVRKYGWDNFTFSVVEETSLENISDRERYWIHFYNSTDPEKGYNQISGDSRPLKLTTEKVEQITKELQQKEVPPQKELARKYGVSTHIISGINTGYYWKRDWIKYPIHRYFSECINEEEKKKEKISNLDRIKQKITDQSKFLALCYISFTEAARVLDEDKRWITKILDSYDIPSSRVKFKVWYEKNYLEKPKKLIKEIKQYDLDNNYIATYRSWVEAAKSIGRGISNGGAHIQAAANTNKTAYGFRWTMEKVEIVTKKKI